MLNDIWTYAVTLVWGWLGVTSGILATALAVYERVIKKEDFHVKRYALVLFIFFVVAGFLAWRDEHSQYEKLRESRPNFSLVKSEVNNMKKDDTGPTLNQLANLLFVNSGVNSAIGVHGRLLFVFPELDKEPWAIKSFSSANEVPHNNLLNIYSDSFLVPSQTGPPFYVYCELKYKDIFDPKTEFSQKWYLKFAGVQNGTFANALFHAEAVEKTQIDAYLHARNLE